MERGAFVDPEGVFYDAQSALDGGLKVEIEYFLKGYSIKEMIEPAAQKIKEKMSQLSQPEKASNIRIVSDIGKRKIDTVFERFENLLVQLAGAEAQVLNGRGGSQ